MKNEIIILKILKIFKVDNNNFNKYFQEFNDLKEEFTKINQLSIVLIM